MGNYITLSNAGARNSIQSVTLHLQNLVHFYQDS